jgi:hypothetical protein
MRRRLDRAALHRYGINVSLRSPARPPGLAGGPITAADNQSCSRLRGARQRRLRVIAASVMESLLTLSS